MLTNSMVSRSDTLDLSSEIIWRDLYPSLRSFAKYLVYSFNLSAWRGQEEDVVEDVVQETVRRLLERARQAERGEATPILSLKHMMTVIAHNYCQDLRRHDCRLLRIPSHEYLPEVHDGMGEQTDVVEEVTEKVSHELLFTQLARAVANFPEKQRKALLTDLANRMCFDTQPTPLQKAFLKVGIQLEQYQQPLPTNPQERSRHISLLSYAYKRMAGLPCVQEYIAVA